MSETNASASYRFALAALAQLAASGVRSLVASPGFRNSPLLLAAHRTPGLDVITAVDERGAAFFALGLARAQHLPVALLCTSGTAVGNYLPAIMEANHSQVPLIVLTADRPQELVGSGANQVTDQTKIFGSQVRLFADTAPPSGAAHEANHAGHLVGRAVSRALQPVPGPVHLNLRFREPFLPPADQCARLEAEPRPSPWSFLSAATGPSEEQALALSTLLRTAKRPLLVLGPGGFSQKILGLLNELSSRTGIPLLAEAASGLAFGEGSQRARLVHRGESALQAMARGKLPAADLFLRIGSPLTGRPYSQLLAASGLPQIVFEDWGETREPTLYPSVIVEGGLEGWLTNPTVWNETKPDPHWVEQLLVFDKGIEARIESTLAAKTTLTEWGFQRELNRLLGQGANLFLGNSMPIRDFNSVFPRSEKRLRLFSNRGLSGIDGLIASAVGVAAGSSRETHAILGDLSTLHDLPSLALASALRERINLTLWIMNNGGGEIFRIVQTAQAGAPQEWFTTPQEFDLSALAKSFRLPFDRITSLAALQALDHEPFAQDGVRMIELRLNPEENLAVRKAIHDES